MADPVLWGGALVAAGAAGASLVLRDPRRRAFAMALALVLAAVLIAADNWDDERLRDLRDSPATLALVLAGGGALLAALAAAFLRFPLAFPLLAFAALPFRIPVEAGGDSANLLLPLYAVIAAAALADVAAHLRKGAGATDARPAAAEPQGSGFAAAAVRWLPAALAAYIALYALQGLYSGDFSKALANLGFFFVPFAALAAQLIRVEWTPRLLTLALAVVAGEAVVFGLVGFAEYATRELLWNDALIEANQVHAYFRVNSLFWDPNILGRYLALAVIAAAAWMLWSPSRRAALRAAGLAAFLLAALAITFSQSSLVALLAGLAALAALRWSLRWTALVCAGLAAIAAAAIAIGGGFEFDVESRRSLNVQTSGRAELIRGGLELAADRPLAGHGSGSFAHKFSRRFRSGREAADVASHTEQVTVAAEQGAIGLLAYTGLAALAIAALAGGIRAVAPGLRGGGRTLGAEGSRAVAIARAALLAGLVAMVVHSLSYAAFLTDPITWAILAVGLALARGGRGA